MGPYLDNSSSPPDEFSVEGGELTPTFKIKRAVVNEMYATEIDKVYEMGQAI